MTTAAEHIRAGDLQAARALLVEAVRANPADAVRRFELAELQIVLGEWEKADGHLQLVSTQDPTWTPVTALMRQLVRAAMARDEVFAAGRAPEFAVDPTPEVAASLAALVAARAGGEAPPTDDSVGAALRGEADGRAFEGLRDLDDRLAPVLEVLTSTGRYMWAPWSRVRVLTLRPPERLRDLVWRAAELELEDGPEGVVYLPVLYPAPAGEPTDAHRLGRATDWVEENGRVRGLGLRVMLVGEEDVALSDLTEVAVAPSPVPTAAG